MMERKIQRATAVAMAAMAGMHAGSAALSALTSLNMCADAIMLSAVLILQHLNHLHRLQFRSLEPLSQLGQQDIW